jgi:hypothetical protein
MDWGKGSFRATRRSCPEASRPSVLSHWTPQLTVREDEFRRAVLGPKPVGRVQETRRFDAFTSDLSERIIVGAPLSHELRRRDYSLQSPVDNHGWLPSNKRFERSRAGCCPTPTGSSSRCRSTGVFRRAVPMPPGPVRCRDECRARARKIPRPVRPACPIPWWCAPHAGISPRV